MDANRFIVCRKFNITLHSANDLENVRNIFNMKVYCKVSFGGDSKTEKRTPIDRHGKKNPAWNHRMVYTIAEPSILQLGLMLVIKLYCKRKLGDRYIGEVHISAKKLFDYAYPRGGNGMLTVPLQKGSENTYGELKFSYSFGERISIEKPSCFIEDNFGIIS